MNEPTDILEQLIIQPEIQLPPTLHNWFHLWRIPREITQFNARVIEDFRDILQCEIRRIIKDYDQLLIKVLSQCSEGLDRHIRVGIALTPT